MFNTNRPRIICSEKEFYRRRDREIYEGDNPWYAGIGLDHSPTREECLQWYKDHGGYEDFASRHRIRGEAIIESFVFTSDIKFNLGQTA